MSPLTLLALAAAVSAATTAICVAAILLAFGHVQNDRQACLVISRGAECALTWEPVQ